MGIRNIGLGGHTMLGAVYLLILGARLVTAGLRGEEGGLILKCPRENTALWITV